MSGFGAAMGKTMAALPPDGQNVDAEDAKTLVTAQGDLDTKTALAPKHACPQCGFEVPLSVTQCPKDGTAIGGDAEGRKLVGNYEFLEFVGSGGMGVIYKARHPVLKRLVAVKMLHSHLMNEMIAKRFQHEAEAVSGLSHPNIIAVHDFGLSEHGQPYMVMDFIEGKTLSAILRQGPLRVPAVINIVIQLAEGLQHAHEHGVLHRDLKPSNIMVTDYDCDFPEAKIVDFGIAKIMENDSTRVTQTGELIGTPQYMSPEQCRGGTLDARSDIYSLGCVMFEAITGKAPFAGETMVSVIVDQISKPARTLSEVRPDMTFPLELEEMLAKALAKDPQDRFQSMNEFLHEAIEVQKLVAQAEMTRQSKGRIFRLNRDQRQVMLLSIAAGFSLLGVCSSALWFAKTVHSQEFRRANAVADPVALENRPKQLQNRVQIERNKERLAMIAYVDHAKLDRAFADRFFRDDFGLERLDCHNSKFDDTALSLLSNQKMLKRLNLSDTAVTDAGMAFLPLLPMLYEVNVSEDGITDEGVKQIARIPALNYLSLNGNHEITDKGLLYLKNRHLHGLLMSGLNITDAGVESISHIPTLEQLQVNGCKKLTDESAKSIAKCRQLDFLVMEDTGVADAGAAAISHLPHLKQLDFGNNKKLTARGVKALSALPVLARLGLNSSPFAGDWIACFDKFKTLKHLGLCWTGITDADMAQMVSAVTKLDCLEIRGCWNLTDAALKSIAGMKNLKKIEIRDCKFSTPAVDALRKARPKLEVVFTEDDDDD